MPNLCTSCKAPVRWVVMVANGRPNPLNVEPDREKGNVQITEDGKGIVAVGGVLHTLRAAREPLYVSHFATCKYADTHRRK